MVMLNTTALLILLVVTWHVQKHWGDNKLSPKDEHLEELQRIEGLLDTIQRSPDIQTVHNLSLVVESLIKELKRNRVY